MSNKKNTVGTISSKVKEIILEANGGDSDPIVDDDVWAAVQSFVDENGFNSAQIKHYNLFIYETAQQIIDQFRCVKIEENGKTYTIEFGEIFFKPPYFVENDDSGNKLYPTEALQRNITYASALHGDITITPPSGEPSFYEKQPLGHIPVMVLSDLCNLTAIFNDPVKMASHNENFRDVGGYFVVAPKGENAVGATAQRRVLGAQERASTNRVQVFTSRRKQNPKFSKYAEVRSSGNGMHTTTTTVGILGVNKRISAVLPWIEATEIPLAVLFKALGIEEERDMTVYVLGPEFEKDVTGLEFLIPTLEYSYECNTQELALLFIGKKARKFAKEEDIMQDGDQDDEDLGDDDEDEEAKEDAREKEREKGRKKAISEEKMRTDAISYATRLLSAELFPHVGSGQDTFVEKAKYLGYMVQKLIWVILNRRKAECRDHYMNKRVLTPASLLAQQFYGAFRRLITEITNNTKKALKTGNSVNILSWIKPTIITNAMNGAISGNNWSTGGPAAKGISQLYEEFNHASCAANMRKLTVPMAAEGGKVIEPRDLHGSHFGVICPSETPEGKKAGLVKNMAFTSLITVGSDPAPVKKIILSILGTRAKRHYPVSLKWARVFLNGAPMGETETPLELVRQLVVARRSAKINAETSIAYFAEYNEVQISVDGGRLARPLFVVENGEMPFRVAEVEKLTIGEMTWTQLLATGMVELVDKAEEENYVIAGFPSDLEAMKLKKDPKLLRITHCEIHPSLMYGIGGSIIPFPDHNQSPRNCYQASMGKQAVGIPFTNYQQIMSGTFHTMEYLQKPLCLSRAGSIVGFDEMPSGQNAIIAVMPRPYNEEDSIEMSKASVDRGFMVSYKYMCYYSEIREEKREIFGIPDESNCENTRGRSGNIGEEGFPKSGTIIKAGDVIIGKFTENDVSDALIASKKKRYTDASMVYDHPWPARVTRIQVGTTGEGYQYIRVMLAQRRVPIVGDKFSARHGQKGTIGKLVAQEDLPFDSQGVTPDIIVNSLAFPSRMTIAMLMELLSGKVIISTSRLHKISVEEALGDDSHLSEAKGEAKGKKDACKTEKLSDAFVSSFLSPTDPTCIDATPFRTPDNGERKIDIIRAEMAKYGFDCGDEQMTDGVTGKLLRCLIFFGPVFYQRLKHFAIDKVHGRAKGGRTTLMRQPKEGRAQGGGLRMGVMERDCVLGQGAACFERDRLMICSDEFKMWVCDICGIQAHTENKGQTKECKICGTNQVTLRRLPYGTKLVNQELMAMNIVSRVLNVPHKKSAGDATIDE